MENQSTTVEGTLVESTSEAVHAIRRGGQPDNRNNQRHGLRSGKLPVGCKYLERAVGELRAALEQAVAESTGGEISITAASGIDLACRCEQHAGLCRRWLRLNGDELTFEQQFRCSESMVRATERRDKAIKSLDLKTSALDSIKRRLYSKRQPLGDLT